MRYVRQMREAYTNALSGVREQLAQIRAEIEQLEAEGISPDRQMVILEQRFTRAQDELVNAITEFSQEGADFTRSGQLELVDYSTGQAMQVGRLAAGDVGSVGLEWGLTRPSREVLDQLV